MIFTKVLSLTRKPSNVGGIILNEGAIEMKKRILALALSAAMALSLAACSGGGDASGSGSGSDSGCGSNSGETKKVGLSMPTQSLER